MSLVSIADLDPSDIAAIWSLVEDTHGGATEGSGQACHTGASSGHTVAWSFEGRGVRTRAAFVQAFRDLGLAWTELPDLLQTTERPQDLAGYLDPYFDAYVIRAADDERMRAFAAASQRPVINAMSRREHPCEVLTDAWFVDRFVRPLSEATVCLWGPTTNVLRSWHALARVLHLDVIQVCDEAFHERDAAVTFVSAPRGHQADVVITDAWPAGAVGSPMPLTEEALQALGSPALLPTPPFTIGAELAFDPAPHPRFVGYHQKQWLLPVHRAILRWALRNPEGGRG
ncbi:MAG: ornithine carbamoyltransferase [Rubrivivax sp.]